MKELSYPFDGDNILRKRKAIKRELNKYSGGGIRKKIAILGGSTTHDLREILELFLLNYGISPEFYESEYNQYWQDAMFGNQELTEFQPELIYIHTNIRNIKKFPRLTDSADDVNSLLEETFQHYSDMWKRLNEHYHCPIIQNNFEYLPYRILGNKDAADFRGKVNFVNRLNYLFYEYSNKQEGFYINDVNYLSSCYGLYRWLDSFYWHMYKYAIAVPAIPELAFNIANIIKAVYGKNKKAFVLDLDNTLWGGVVGEDGADQIEIGDETSMGQTYREFQQYLKDHKDLGIVLNINSKNDIENAMAGLGRPDSILKPEDFAVIKANWDSKDKNLREIAKSLNLHTDSMVFVDDNPAERHIIEMQLPEVAVPYLSEPEEYIRILDRSGFFEPAILSEDDLKRNAMYQENAKRIKLAETFEDYQEYLQSLEMVAEIEPFNHMYMSRIAQLTNKSNQFNLTTKRCTLNEIQLLAEDSNYITLYGKLMDKFGDNGVVSVLYGKQEGITLSVELWLMSCRVLKRDMEYAMMDALASQCMNRGITKITGNYYPTAKNKMVQDFYGKQGFKKISEDVDGNSAWEFDLSQGYKIKNHVIKIKNMDKA